MRTTPLQWQKPFQWCIYIHNKTERPVRKHSYWQISARQKGENYAQTVYTPYLDVFEAHCTTPGCPYVNIKEYNKNP